MNEQTMIPCPGAQSIEQRHFNCRMARQMRIIERYRWRRFLMTGYLMTADEAAAEWIALFAAEFPA